MLLLKPFRFGNMYQKSKEIRRVNTFVLNTRMIHRMIYKRIPTTAFIIFYVIARAVSGCKVWDDQIV